MAILVRVFALPVPFPSLLLALSLTRETARDQDIRRGTQWGRGWLQRKGWPGWGRSVWQRQAACMARTLATNMADVRVHSWLAHECGYICVCICLPHTHARIHAQTQRHRDIETQTHRDTETQRHTYMQTHAGTRHPDTYTHAHAHVTHTMHTRTSHTQVCK